MPLQSQETRGKKRLKAGDEKYERLETPRSTDILSPYTVHLENMGTESSLSIH